MITVVVDDLAALAADAVVRPADESLEPAAAVATRLDRPPGTSSPSNGGCPPRWKRVQPW